MDNNLKQLNRGALVLIRAEIERVGNKTVFKVSEICILSKGPIDYVHLIVL